MIHETALRHSVAGTGDFIDFSGVWVNELTSEMTIQQTGQAIQGKYESAVSDAHAKTPGRLVGFVDGKLIAFTVRWEEFQAITSWVGQVQNDKIDVLWQMTRTVSVGEE